MPGQRGTEKRMLTAPPVLVRLDIELASRIAAAAEAQDLTSAAWLRALAVSATDADPICAVPTRASRQPPPPAPEVVVKLAELRHVVAELGGSSLYASRFRECAARSLLLPRRDPKRRSQTAAPSQLDAAADDVSGVRPGRDIE